MVRVIGSIPLDHAPGAIGVNPVTNQIYIATSANWLTVIDGATNEKITSFYTGSRFSAQFGIDSRRNRIFMPDNHGNGLVVIDGETNKEISSMIIGSNPEGVGVDSDTHTAYVAHSASVLTLIDTMSLASKGFVYTAKYNHTLAVNSRLHRAYVALTDPFHTDVIDTSTNTKIGFIQASGNADANYVTGKLYMADYRYNYVTVVDGRTNRILGTITKDSPAGFVTVNPTTNCVYVTNPDSNTISVIDGRTDKLVASVGTGQRPQQIAVNPANGLIYVANTGAKSVYIIRDNLCGRQQRVWRLLYYLPGDNVLIDAQGKMVQRLRQTEGNNFFHTSVLLDGPEKDDSRYLVIGETVDELAKGELNTGDSRTLLEWVHWSREIMPASYTALIIVGHGNLSGATIDEGAGADSLLLREIRDVLAEVAARYGRVDVLYMNSSLMGTIEGGYELQPYVDYYVSSQNTSAVDVDRLPTSYLNHMASNLTPHDLAMDMGRSSADGLRSLGLPFTISVADLRKLPALVDGVNEFSDRIRERMANVAPVLRDRILPQTQRFDMNGANGTDLNDDLIDLYDFVDRVGRDLPDNEIRDAVDKIKRSIQDEYIIYEAHSSGLLLGTPHTLANSHGVSIFFPTARSSFYTENQFGFAAGTDWNTPNLTPPAAAAVRWGPMLVSYVMETNPEAPDHPTPPPLVVPAQEPDRLFLPMLVRPRNGK